MFRKLQNLGIDTKGKRKKNILSNGNVSKPYQGGRPQPELISRTKVKVLENTRFTQKKTREKRVIWRTEEKGKKLIHKHIKCKPYFYA